MPKARFVLREPKAKKEQSIILIFRYKSQRFFKSLDISILPKHWSLKNQRVKNTNDVPNKDVINDYLNNLALNIERIYITLTAEGKHIDNKVLLDELNKQFNLKKEDNNFWSTLDNFIKDSKKRVNPKTHRPISESTINTYRETYKVLQDFENNSSPIHFNTITLDFYYNWIEYMHEKKSFSLNYCGKHIKNLKTFLSDATEKGLNTNLAFQSKRFSVLKEDTDQIYLNDKELEKLFNFDFSFDPKLEVAVDLFLIGAYTGLRVSDFTQLNSEDIILRDTGKVIKVHTKKTDELVFIPLMQNAEQILNKYANCIPNKISEPTINKQIKIAGRLAGITSKVQITKTIQGKKLSRTYFKYELIKTHTARRSFCTNAYLAGVDTMDIMAISGHKTETSFVKYVKVSKEQHADKMLQHPFFRKQNLKVVS
ncbi:MAG: tyrosine-type recombinase/integrase [Bacteroidales bacterium]